MILENITSPTEQLIFGTICLVMSWSQFLLPSLNVICRKVLALVANIIHIIIISIFFLLCVSVFNSICVFSNVVLAIFASAFGKCNLCRPTLVL